MRVLKCSMTRFFVLFILVSCALSTFAFSCNAVSNKKLDEMNDAAAHTVLLNNAAGFVPLKKISDYRIASLNLGLSASSAFDSLLSKYAAISRFTSTSYPKTELHMLLNDLKLYNLVIVRTSAAVLADPLCMQFLNDLKLNRQLIVNLNGSESGLLRLADPQLPVIWSPNGTDPESEFAAQLIFGGVAASARLPRAIASLYKKGEGYSTSVIRLKYTVPEELGINSNDLKPIDDIVNSAIAAHVTPSAVVMVVKDGKVIFDKAYGKHTYKDSIATRIDDIYDLASVTKITATTMEAMRLFETGRLNLDTTLNTYFPLSRGTDKASIRIRQLMLHEAGLIPYIPFQNYIQASDHSKDSSALYAVKVADGYYVRRNYYEDLMLPKMLNSTSRTRGKYVYSDVSMYFMKEVIEHISKQKLENLVMTDFYSPLGMQTAGFRPRERFGINRIVPTENDTYFRKTLLQGYVHDQGAALAGGVAGHAGVFADANDLAILFQMLLNGGEYGGERYFEKSTVDLFTSRQSASSRRGLGFDRWDPDPSTPYPSELASPETYGHTGFTGTCVWVDPKQKLVYIFLSNRLNDQPANKLSSTRVRPRIQDVIYRALAKAPVLNN